MRSLLAIIAAALSSTALVGCERQGTRDPDPRPQTVEEYMAAMNAAGDDPKKIPMLLREQKRLAIKDMGGVVDASDFRDIPRKSREFSARWRETGVAYFNAPFGTVEERRAWEEYMTVINGEATASSEPVLSAPAEGAETGSADILNR